MLARSSLRNGATVRVLAVHTSEGILKAADLAAWSSWAGSSHAAADTDGVLLTPADGFVPYERASWTLRSGNPWSENIELCGFAKWKRDDWLARPKLLDACARWLGARSAARGIPLVKLTPKEYAAGRSGVIGHVDHTVGYSDGTHWDPGPDFPWDVVLDKAAAYAGPTTEEPFVALTDDEQRRLLAAAEKTAWLAEQIKPQTDRLTDVQAATDALRWGVLDEAHGLRVQVARLLADDDTVTPEDLAAAIPDSIAERVVELLARRLSDT